MKTFEEKYAPGCFDDLVFENEEDRQLLSEYATQERNRHLLLWGGYGFGKSAAAQMIAAERSRDGVYGGGFERHSAVEIADDFDAALRRIAGSWNLEAFRQNRVLPMSILDELHILELRNQYKLRAFMDRVKSGLFIFTANRLSTIDGSVLSRCDVVELKPLSPPALLPRCKSILQSERVTIADELLLELLSTTDGSWPDVLRALEGAVVRVRGRSPTSLAPAE